MLNIDYWRNRLEYLHAERGGISIIDDVPCLCSNTRCSDCELKHGHCANIFDWYMKEHEEPKAIDWDKDIDWMRVPVNTTVLVRDDEDEEWRKSFFAVYIPNSGGNKYTTFGFGEKWADASYVNFWGYCKLVNEEDIEKYRKR